jgi:hypothetical protein
MGSIPGTSQETRRVCWIYGDADSCQVQIESLSFFDGKIVCQKAGENGKLIQLDFCGSHYDALFFVPQANSFLLQDSLKGESSRYYIFPST